MNKTAARAQTLVSTGCVDAARALSSDSLEDFNSRVQKVDVK